MDLQPGELLVRAEAIGVTLPGVRQGGDLSKLGGEVAGDVIAIGPGVEGYAVGDRVVAVAFAGAYATEVVVPVFTTSRIPEHADYVQAVALVRSGQVALAVLATAQLGGGESVLITGAASGVGHLVVQLARIQGAGRVVAAVGSAQKEDFVRGLGADEVVVYSDESWGEPVDVGLDAVGGELLPRAVSAVRPGGRVVFFGSGGGTVPAYDLLAGSKTVTGCTVGFLARTRPGLYQRHHEQLWQLHRDGLLRAEVHAEIPLADAAQAHRIIEARANLGKVVLRP